MRFEKGQKIWFKKEEGFYYGGEDYVKEYKQSYLKERGYPKIKRIRGDNIDIDLSPVYSSFTATLSEIMIPKNNVRKVK